MRVPRAVPDAVTRAVTRAVARAKPVVPQQAWPFLLSLRSLRGDGPLVAPPDLESALVLAAHPDDESLGCAGTVALLTDAGARVSAAFATDGDATRGADLSHAEVARRRRAEAVEACRRIGIVDVAFWGLPDGDLPQRISDLRARLTAVIRDTAPDGIFIPWFLDGHPDHEALSTALLEVEVDSRTEIWGYETWTPLPANRVVDITATWDRKKAAVAAHVTAALAFDLEAALGLNRWRSIHGLMGRGYAEAFLVARADDWGRLQA